MINGLGVFGWGVGGIEAEAVMLGQPYYMLTPAGGRLPARSARCRPAPTATDLVLTVTQMLRKHGVVGKFVEFYGPALAQLPLADRATIANMAPEYGATMGFFPVDDETLDYLRLSGRRAELVALVEALLQGAGAVPHRGDAGPASSPPALELDLSHRRAEPGRAEAAAGPRAAATR